MQQSVRFIDGALSAERGRKFGVGVYEVEFQFGIDRLQCQGFEQDDTLSIVDGKTDIAVFRDGLWYVMQSSDNQVRYKRWGLSSDALTPGDYDGDGKTDISVYRNGVNYVQYSSNSASVYQPFGLAGDLPVASAYVR